MPKRGRPPLQSDETILEAALRSFASAGFDATSVRALNAELGLSHETITQRFGTKSELYRSAVGHGLQQFVTEFDREIESQPKGNELDLLRATLRAFMIAISHHPTLGELLHHRGLADGERQVLMADVGLGNRMLQFAQLLQRLHADGSIRDVTLREVWFLAQGAAGPLRFQAVAVMFDPIDGPIDPDRHLERMVDTIMRAISVS